MNDHHRGYRYEFLDADGGEEAAQQALASAAAASDRGAGALGFAGTAHKDAAEATGLATLAGAEFGGGPSVPMVPATWEPRRL